VRRSAPADVPQPVLWLLPLLFRRHGGQLGRRCRIRFGETGLHRHGYDVGILTVARVRGGTDYALPACSQVTGRNWRPSTRTTTRPWLSALRRARPCHSRCRVSLSYWHSCCLLSLNSPTSPRLSPRVAPAARSVLCAPSYCSLPALLAAVGRRCLGGPFRAAAGRGATRAERGFGG